LKQQQHYTAIKIKWYLRHVIGNVYKEERKKKADCVKKVEEHEIRIVIAESYQKIIFINDSISKYLIRLLFNIISFYMI